MIDDATIHIGAMRKVAAHLGSRQDMANGDESEDEGLKLLLGGLTMSTISSAAWDDDEVAPQQSVMTTTRPIGVPDIKEGAETTRTIPLIDIMDICEDETFGFFDRAFHCTPNGELVPPPVRIVGLSSINNRGNGLVATRNIQKGEVIFTESAIEAAQLPSECTTCRNEQRESWQSSYSVRACQNCFRSLESISIFGGKLPLPELWPIPEFKDSKTMHRGYRVDVLERLQCVSCCALFCSKTCSNAHENRMGSCCRCSEAVNEVVHSLHSQECLSMPDGPAEQDMIDPQPAVLLATRIFVSLLNQYRLYDRFYLGPFESLCGSPRDVTPLELGLEDHQSKGCSENGGIRRYTLRPVYEAVCNALSITQEEKKYFKLDLFHRLAAISARNAFNVTTQSPFRTYHAGLLRAAGGRGTDRHMKLMEQVAIALGSKDGSLQRDMDRKVEERCAVQVVALFSLTARSNHSCDPCAEVRSQEFVDCNIDLVAKRDIL